MYERNTPEVEIASRGLGLIETFGWGATGGFRRLERHLARLSSSAAAFGWSFCESDLRRRLLACVDVQSSPHRRIRIELDAKGTPSIVATTYEPMPADMVWTVFPVSQKLRSNDPLLAHKTTRRKAYDRARAEAAAAGADEAILCNERGELCEGAFTSLFVQKAGTLLTPPLACGLLPGVLRAELLEAGHAREAVLTLADLQCAEAIYVGNSLRGLIPARLLPA